MEVRVRERLIGALVLVAVVVLLVPAILKGPAPEPAAEQRTAQTRRVEVPLGATAQAPDAQAPVPEEPVGSVELPPSLAEARTQAPAVPEPRPAPSSAAAKPAGNAPREPTPAAPTVARPPKTVPAPTAAAGGWAVQVAAFSTRSKADQVVADLRKRGYAAFVFDYRASGKVLYRVRVGPEPDRDRAAAIAARLAKDGYQPVVARHP
ncbi:MAG TPA: SPOR domain-containing protein [Steroidobacteraceae bacterium]|nr:SPOR domain-containing protein [Steroidobacteraceae bacterium]